MSELSAKRASRVTMVVTLLAVACGGDGGTGPPDTTVASVVVTPPLSTFRVLETAQLSASPRNAAGSALSGKTVTWTSSNNAMATVSSSGLVTGVSEGTVTITATSEGIPGTAQVVVNPAEVASVEVAPDPDTVKVGQSIQLTPTVRDQAGGELTGRTVTWASSDDAIATVSATGLVTGVAVGSVRITATSEGVDGTSEVEVILDDFVPTANTELSGEVDYGMVDIPAGVTVTVTDDLVMNVADEVTINGTLAGDCVAITINGGANMNIGGTIDNGCPAETEDPPAMTLVSDGATDIADATIIVAGDLDITNDPTLDESAIPVSGGSAAATGAATDHIFIGVRNTTFQADPAQARNGTDGQHGTDGRDARTWRLLARGNLIFGGGVNVIGQHGGDGGNGLHEHATAADASGGKGGGRRTHQGSGDRGHHLRWSGEHHPKRRGWGRGQGYRRRPPQPYSRKGCLGHR